MRRDKDIETITLKTNDGEWSIHCYDDEIVSYKFVGGLISGFHKIKTVNSFYAFKDSYVNAVLIKYQGEY